VVKLKGSFFMTPENILARVALELKFSIDPKTQEQISSLYSTVTGETPTKRTKLLDWFLANFEFDGIDTWYHRERRLPN
jgi:hypothetical protein